jgi:hypothetical protein
MNRYEVTTVTNSIANITYVVAESYHRDEGLIHFWKNNTVVATFAIINIEAILLCPEPIRAPE